MDYSKLSHDDLLSMVTAMDKRLSEYEKSLNYHTFETFLPSRLEKLISFQQRHADQAIGGVKAFTQDLIVWMRAIAMVAESAGNAGTHSEKNARLRGMVDLIESALQKVRDHDFRLVTDRYWSAPDVFRSDYPVRHFMEKMHEMEQEVKRLKVQAGELSAEQIERTDDGELPF